MEIKLFGKREAGKEYKQRDGAYLLTRGRNGLYPMISNEEGVYLIGGGIEINETPEQALIREVGEEIGCHIKNLFFVCDNISYYQLNDIDWCSHNYFYYAEILDEYKESEDENKLIWNSLESTLNTLTLEHQRWGISYFYETFVKYSKKTSDIHESLKFVKAIRTENYDLLKEVPKSDLHNHAPFGASPELFYKETGKQVDLISNHFHNLKEMSIWCDKNVSREFDRREGFLKRIECAFKQAHDDGITKLSLNFGVCSIKYFDSARDMVDSIEGLKEQFYKNREFLPELCLDRNKFSTQYVEEYYALLNTNYFHSIDLTGDENEPIDFVIPLFESAKKKGLILKAHIGEFGDAESVLKTIKSLNLDQIQHGISIVDSKQCLAYVLKKGIQLNIAVTSNYHLSRVTSIKNHPIRKLFDTGVKLTINTDDDLIFNTDINKEYIKLYLNGVFTPKELNIIRLQGLYCD